MTDNINEMPMNTNNDEATTITEEKKKSSVADVLHKVSDFGKKVGENTQKNAKVFLEKAKNDNYLRRMKKYNPLFPDVYQSENFNLPNIIMIVDEAIRRDIDVCEGAIGWTSNKGRMEVLHLYDDAVSLKNITFVPSVSCDAIYFVDNFDPNRYINIDSIFTKSHEERLSELEYIAYSLGARSCSIEIIETDTESKLGHSAIKSRKSADIKNISVTSDENFENDFSFINSSQRSGHTKTKFAGSDNPVPPTLKWFAHDDNIKKLIEMRCSDTNAIKSRRLELEGSSSATMSYKTALAIDATVMDIGIKKQATMENQAKKENHSKLIFEIEF
ncbi:MAG: hypothetical protein IJ489_08475 [Clostridia bacterium]|nr:hypothetical protein [Clostridia bacterium]